LGIVFYYLLLTSTVKAKAIEVANWTDLNDVTLGVASSDVTLHDALETNGSVFITLMTSPDDHDEAALIGLQASKPPGSSNFKFRSPKNITAETNLTLINSAREKKGNVFFKQSGATYYVEGVMTSGKFIDQKVSRDYVRVRVKERMLALFISEEKINYDDTGIAQLVSTLSDQLTAFGGTIIANAVSATEIENSFNGRHQFKIIAPTRAEMVANFPAMVTAREYALEFEYVEAGAINTATVTGKIILSLV